MAHAWRMHGVLWRARRFLGGGWRAAEQSCGQRPWASLSGGAGIGAEGRVFGRARRGRRWGARARVRGRQAEKPARATATIYLVNLDRSELHWRLRPHNASLGGNGTGGARGARGWDMWYISPESGFVAAMEFVEIEVEGQIRRQTHCIRQAYCRVRLLQ